MYCICTETCPGLTYGNRLPTPISLTPSLFQVQREGDVFWAVEGRGRDLNEKEKKNHNINHTNEKYIFRLCMTDFQEDV